MTELNELVAVSVPDLHPADDPNCPFCPKEPPEEWTTYGGASNDSKKLAAIIDNPTKLASLQPGVRPKVDHAAHRQASDPMLDAAAVAFRQEHRVTFQAHHLVSGKQALVKSLMEHWISAGPEVAADSGYSVNNAANGAWLPSIPKAWVGLWGKESDEHRYTLAVEVMRELGAQIHVGPHNPDVDDDDAHHQPYDVWLITTLEGMGERIGEWEDHCPLCERPEGEKLRPSVRVNEALDRLSRRAWVKVTGPASDWDVFISKYAWWYHSEVTTERPPRFKSGAFEQL